MNFSKLTPDEAAIKIQKTWKRYLDISLFKKLKKLVMFRNQGDPSTLLKVINPVEAQLLDPAIGAHVRFRLGGLEWPPQIYYKIFLHSPVCDVNSYAPRNYAKKDSQIIPPINPNELSDYAEKFGWYQRIENNGWRPISSLSPTAIDTITQITSKESKKKSIFKPKPKKKLKKEVAEIKVKRFLQSKKDKLGDLTEVDLNDDQLFEWAESLDIQEYLNEWETIGTTGPSSNLWWKLEDSDDNEEILISSSDSEINEEELLKLIQ